MHGKDVKNVQTEVMKRSRDQSIRIGTAVCCNPNRRLAGVLPTVGCDLDLHGHSCQWQPDQHKHKSAARQGDEALTGTSTSVPHGKAMKLTDL